ncbi:hypothetical protein FHS10_004318 [Mucilaginibacter dorajii]|nr:hypothetical protein [Mucilaginibacter dorajii]
MSLRGTKQSQTVQIRPVKHEIASFLAMTCGGLAMGRNEGSSSPSPSQTFIAKKILHYVQDDKRFLQYIIGGYEAMTVFSSYININHLCR